MKRNASTDAPRKRGVLTSRLNLDIWRKHYTAITADEETWPQSESGRNLGRIFVLLLLLHVFIIAAVVLYNIVAPKPAPVSRDVSPEVVKKTEAPTAKPTVAVKTDSPQRPAATPTTPAQPPLANSGPKTEMGTYEVRSGDNVPGIANALGVSQGELIKLNNLETTDLFPGRKLMYPKKPAPKAIVLQPAKVDAVKIAASATPAPSADKLKMVTPPSSSNANTPPKPKENVASSTSDSPPKAIVIKPSTTTKIEDQPPSPKPVVKNTESSTPPAADKTKSESKTDTKKVVKKTDKSSKDSSGRKTYVVTSKDTLYSISRKYGVKVDALQKANNIKDPTLLHEGMKLVIPSKN